MTDESTGSLLGEFARDLAAELKVQYRFADVYAEQNGYSVEICARLRELGGLSLVGLEEEGGSGMSVLDTLEAAREFGRSLVPGPLFTAGVLAPCLLAGTSHDGALTADDAELPPVVIPALTAGVFDDVEDPWTVRSDRQSSMRIDGHAAFLLDLEYAEDLLITFRGKPGVGPGEGDHLALIPRSRPGVRISPQRGMLTSFGSLTLEDVEVLDGDIVRPQDGAEVAITDSVIESLPFILAYYTGAMSAVREFTLEYSRERRAFGQPIGRFQRVQDHIIELVNFADGASLLLDEVRDGSANYSPTAVKHAAKAFISDAYYKACNFSHMVHAGPGTAWGHDLMSHTLVSRGHYQFLGAPAVHRRRFMDAVLADSSS